MRGEWLLSSGNDGNGEREGEEGGEDRLLSSPAFLAPLE